MLNAFPQNAGIVQLGTAPVRLKASAVPWHTMLAHQLISSARLSSSAKTPWCKAPSFLSSTFLTQAGTDLKFYSRYLAAIECTGVVGGHCRGPNLPEQSPKSNAVRLAGAKTLKLCLSFQLDLLEDTKCIL